jgi:hypothetical protein
MKEEMKKALEEAEKKKLTTADVIDSEENKKEDVQMKQGKTPKSNPDKFIKIPKKKIKPSFKIRFNRWWDKYFGKKVKPFTDEYKFKPSDYKLPIPITVTNTTTETIKGVSLFNYNHRFKSDVLYAGVNGEDGYDLMLRKIACLNGGVRLGDLKDTKDRCLLIGMIRIQSSNASQTFQGLTFSDRTIDGTATSWPVRPLLDPYQNQGGVTGIKNTFALYNGVDIKFDLLPAATVQFYLFEKADVKPKPLTRWEKFIGKQVKK